jgi:hypothetical protein
MSTFVGNARCVHLRMQCVSNKGYFFCKQPLFPVERQYYFSKTGDRNYVCFRNMFASYNKVLPPPLLQHTLALFFSVQSYTRSWDGSVGIVTGYGIDGRGLIPGSEREGKAIPVTVCRGT